MSKTVAPLLSFDARGQLGQTLVYSTWKGRAYARRYVIPANPRTAAQTAVRETWAGLNRIMQYMPAGALAAWELYGENSRITARNGFIKQNLSALREATDLQPLLLSPSAGGGLALEAATFTRAGAAITADPVPPTLPEGWTLAAVHALAVRNDAPREIITPHLASASTTDAPWTVTIDGTDPAAAYVVGAWAEYVKPSGGLAFGASAQALLAAA